MPTPSHRTRPDRPWLIAALLAYFAIGAALLPLFQYPAIDLLAYVSVAQKWAAGDLAAAVNGCWGPLGSWVVVPFLWAGVEPLFAYRVVALLLGAITLLGIVRLSRHFEMSTRLRGFVLLLCVPWVLSFWYVPDLLIVCVFAHYLAWAFDPEFTKRPGIAAACGALGALAYFGKAYGVPLFVAHYSLTCVWHGLRDRRAALRTFAIGIAVFVVLAAPWVVALSAKYGKFTISTVSQYTHAVLGPDSRDHPIFVDGLFDPPNATAISIWEDPSLIEVAGWSPFDSTAALWHQVKMVAWNTRVLAGTLVHFSWLSVVILLGYAALCFPLRSGLRGAPAFTLATFALLPAGYLFVQMWPHWPGRGRYVWLDGVLLVLMGGHLLHRLFRRQLGARLRAAVLVVFAGALLVYPVRALWSVHTWNSDYREIGDHLAGLGLEGATASDSWFHLAQYLSYRMGCQYYGQRDVDATDAEFEADLRRHGIDYLLWWGDRERDDEPLPAFLQGRLEIAAGHHPVVRIFSLGEDR